jgi:hypothetical protein
MTAANQFDTHIGSASGDTLCLNVSAGESVRISAGMMQGAEATVVQPRTHGRILVRVGRGLYVEIHQFCLEKIKKIS